MQYHVGMYFRNAVEANDWLEFDCVGEVQEYKAYSEPDHYAEWERWRKDEMSTKELDLQGVTNAQVWAKEFMKVFSGGATVDEGLMIGWFANAIESAKSATIAKYLPPPGDNSSLGVAWPLKLFVCQSCGRPTMFEQDKCCTGFVHEVYVTRIPAKVAVVWDSSREEHGEGPSLGDIFASNEMARAFIQEVEAQSTEESGLSIEMKRVCEHTTAK